MTETVGSHYERMLEVVIALDAYEVLAPEVTSRAIASIRTIVEQWHTIGTCSEEDPAQTNLQVGESSRFVVVAIGVVTLYPSYQLLRIDGMAVTLHVLAHPVGFLEVVTKIPTQSGSSHTHIFGIFLLLDVPVLKHLAIDEEAVLGQAETYAIGFLAAGSYCPEVVSRRFLVLRVTGQTDMLGCVVTETAHTTLDQVVAILQIVGLEVGVLGVDVGQTAHLACSALQTIVVVANLIKASGVIEVLVSTDGGIEFVTYACVVDGSVIGQNIDNDANAILASLLAELLEVLTCTNHVVANLPIDRLVIVIPATMAPKLRTTALVALGLSDTILGG